MLAAALIVGNPADAANLKSVRSFANTDKTRVVFDLDADTKWAQVRQQDGRLIVRLKDLSNVSNAPLMETPSAGCITGSKKIIEGKDARYVFMSQTCGAPNVFMLSPRDGNKDWRLVADFPHTSGGSVTSAVNNAAGNKNSSSSANSNKSLKTLEGELFNQYSTAGADGIRSMTPEQAKKYDVALAKLRSDYAKEQVQKANEKNAAKQKVVAKNDDRDTEQVKDTAAPPQAVTVKANAKPFVIAIDAGHGGKDPGAKGQRGVREKDVALAIAKALANYINTDKRLRAVLTRSSDRYVDLDARSAIARKKKAELLISIHCNSTPSATTARGTEILLQSSNRAQRENNKVVTTGKSGKLSGGAGTVLNDAKNNPYLETMVVDMASQNSRSEGYDLGAEILKSIGKFTHLYKKRPVYQSLAVLKAPDIPSLLIETGFLSNKYEEIQLNQPNYQKQMAYRIFLGIQSYYEKNPLSNLKSRIESDNRTTTSSKSSSVAKYVSYKVQKGEYLSKIAAKHGISVAELKRINNLKSDVVTPGQTLKVPK